jgi:hypothetical protein
MSAARDAAERRDLAAAERAYQVALRRAGRGVAGRPRRIETLEALVRTLGAAAGDDATRRKVISALTDLAYALQQGDPDNGEVNRSSGSRTTAARWRASDSPSRPGRESPANTRRR